MELQKSRSTAQSAYLGISSLPKIVTPKNPSIDADIDTTTLSGWRKWYNALKCILPTYLAVHAALLILTILAPIFSSHRYSYDSVPIYTLWHEWARWDFGHFRSIATGGYGSPSSAAFFPLYPLTMRAVIYMVHSPLLAGLLISNITLLIACTVFYQLVLEDFGKKRADRSILYLSIFPSAFFLLATYSESLFLCLAFLCFYHMRRGNWWLAGLFGLLGSLTRSVGVIVALPFFFEYLRQHEFKIRSMLRFNVLSNLLTPAGLGLYCIFCYKKFGDFLAFVHHENIWGRSVHTPWDGLVQAYIVIFQRGQHHFLSFYVLHNILAASVDLFILLIIVLSVVGPWRFPRTHWHYAIYAIMTYLFFHMATSSTNLPLESIVRYFLAIFPIFIILAGLGKHPIFHRCYLIISSSLLFFCALLFLTGRWMT